MLAFILAFAMSILLMMVNRGLANPRTFFGTYYILHGLGILGIAGVVFGIVKEIIDRKNGRDRSRSLVTGIWIAVCSLVVALSAFLLLYRDYAGSIRLLYIVVPALAILYLFYMIFQREFSVLAILGAVVALYFWRFGQFNRGTGRFLAAQCLFLLLCLLGAALLFLLRRGDGELKLGKRRLRLLQTDAEYGASYIFLALLAAVLIAAFFVPGPVMVYLAYLVLALIFVMAVYYAVRMM